MDTFPVENVLVFKTNITSLVEVNAIACVLDSSSHIYDWSVDLDDCDHILRVVSDSVCVEEVIACLRDLGFFCEELEG